MKSFSVIVRRLAAALMLGSMGTWMVCAETGRIFRAETKRAGELATLIDDKIHEIDSLIVEGPIDASDYLALRNATWNGSVCGINLQKSISENACVPERAFYDVKNCMTNRCKLRHITLGEDITEICDEAFYEAVCLEHVRINSDIRILGKECFARCELLNMPENILASVEFVGYRAFAHTLNLKEVVFTSPQLTIDGEAFMNSGVESVTFLDDVEVTFQGTGHFRSCAYLVRVPFAHNMSFIPVEYAASCTSVTSVTIPVRVGMYVSSDAFRGCTALTQIWIGDMGSLCMLDDGCFADCPNVTAIFSESRIAPKCSQGINAPAKKSRGYLHEDPFGGLYYNDNVTVYIPQGALRSYQNSYIWNYFHNYKELSAAQFQAMSGVDMVSDNNDGVMVASDCGDMVISGDSGEHWTVANLMGQQLAVGIVCGKQRISLPSGIYIFKAGRKVIKIAL